MRFSRYIILVFVGFSLSISSYAQTVVGCRIGNDSFLYTGYQGVQPYPVSQYYIPTFPTYGNPKKDFLQDWYNDYSSCPRFVGQPSYGAQCAVQGITFVGNGWVQGLGNTITYTLTYNCDIPIDDDVWILILGSCILALVFLLKKTA